MVNISDPRERERELFHAPNNSHTETWIQTHTSHLSSAILLHLGLHSTGRCLPILFYSHIHPLLKPFTDIPRNNALPIVSLWVSLNAIKLIPKVNHHIIVNIQTQTEYCSCLKLPMSSSAIWYGQKIFLPNRKKGILQEEPEQKHRPIQQRRDWELRVQGEWWARRCGWKDWFWNVKELKSHSPPYPQSNYDGTSHIHDHTQCLEGWTGRGTKQKKDQLA